MVGRFFLLPNPTDMSNCRSRSDHPIILLSGPPSSGKTSLLFHYALNSALEFNGAVVFICSRHKLDTKPPLSLSGC
nr:putative P-loop containing nucleoside triphosphate hydrolase [Ipomoea batatas]